MVREAPMSFRTERWTSGNPLGDAIDTSKLRIEERELEAGGLS